MWMETTHQLKLRRSAIKTFMRSMDVTPAYIDYHIKNKSFIAGATSLRLLNIVSLDFHIEKRLTSQEAYAVPAIARRTQAG